jgi:hypothetical protein
MAKTIWQKCGKKRAFILHTKDDIEPESGSRHQTKKGRALTNMDDCDR